MGHEAQVSRDADGLKLVHELRTLEELRVLSDPLRLLVFRLLKEKERTVKELCDILGESSTRLYYHVDELERIGLVRLVRTDARAGAVQKYYRAVARFLNVPFTLLHDQSGSPEAQAAIEWNARLLEQAAMEIRHTFSEDVEELDDDDYFIARLLVRTTPERAREFVKRLLELEREFMDSDDEQGTIRYTLTTALLPTPGLPVDAAAGEDRHG